MVHPRPAKLKLQSTACAVVAAEEARAFDYVILSQTFQETHRPRKVLREMLRVGRRGIVAFPNFGHWRVRLSMLVERRYFLAGRRKVTLLPNLLAEVAVFLVSAAG
jgi:hypothetical protein